MQTAAVVLATSIVIALALAAGYALGSRRALAEHSRLHGQIDALAANRDVRESLTPLNEALRQLSDRVAAADRSRAATDAGLRENMLNLSQQVQQSSLDVREEARRLNRALSRSEQRGAWGEMQLRRLVESAGMLPHVHFIEQVTAVHEDVVTRPDMIIDLGGGRSVIVDAKVSLDAFLEAGSDDDALQRHADSVANHMKQLSQKRYWQAHGSPEFVIMFLPAEGLLSSALAVRPTLLQDAFDRKVVLATPTTLMATLQSVSYAWQQAEVAQHAREIQEAGTLLYQRLTTSGGKLTKLGRDLSAAVQSYNDTVGSMESRLLPAARRIKDMCQQEAEIALPPVEFAVRQVAAPELVATDPPASSA